MHFAYADASGVQLAKCFGYDQSRDLALRTLSMASQSQLPDSAVGEK